MISHYTLNGITGEGFIPGPKGFFHLKNCMVSDISMEMDTMSHRVGGVDRHVPVGSTVNIQLSCSEMLEIGEIPSSSLASFTILELLEEVAKRL